MKEIVRNKNLGFVYILLFIYLSYVVIDGPGEYSVLNSILSPYGYIGLLIVTLILNLYHIIFWFSKPFGKVWPDRIMIYKSPFKTYDINVRDLTSFKDYGNDNILVKDRSGNIYKISTKAISDKSKIGVLKKFLRNNVERNKQY